MMLSYKIVLITCLSFSLHAMEQKALTTSDNASRKNKDNSNFYAIDNLYKKTYDMLECYKPTELQSIINVTKIITYIHQLKLQNIESKNIGQFAYKQPMRTKLFSSKSSLSHNPLYISIVFDRIGRYNNLLAKNDFSSPTIEQWIHYTNNQKIRNSVAKAETVNIFLDLETINNEKKVLTNLSLDVTSAIQQFNILLKDISHIVEFSPEEVKIIADLVYGPEIKTEQPEKSEKL